MSKFLMLSALFASLCVGDAALCDPKIVEKIYNLWGVNIESYEGLLKYLDDAGHVVVVRGTKGLLQDEDSIDCLGANFNGNTVENFQRYKNGTAVKFPTFTVEDLSTKDLYTSSTKTHRHYLPFNKDDGAVSFYLCDEEGSSGDPRANIVVFPTYQEDAVEALSQTLAEKVGITLVNVYPDTCAVN